MTNPKAKNMEEEMQWNTMRRFKACNNFDFHGMKNNIKRSYTHVYRLEDVWADYENDEDVRRMDFSHLNLEQIENLDLAKIPMTMEDNDNVVDLVYFERKIVDSPLLPIQWSKMENPLLKELPLFWPIVMHGY